MSSVIKMGKRGVNLKIKVSDHGSSFESESEDEYNQRLEEEKREQIFNAGREEAIRELQANYTQSLHQKFLEYETMMKSIKEQMDVYSESFDKIVIDTSFLIANKIINNSISESPIITDTIKNSLSKIIGANNIVFRLNPSDIELIKETEESFLDNNSYSNLKFEADARIEIGGCFVESEIGNVDARISSRLNELKNTLKNEPMAEN